ncbi:kinase domain protein (macronuclear) [Tetrahymena thermophila SB210]|uniref:non-specific serine/threonine protein kinase n=1 Tax=Tetrahymena thermophila (strain SB210) TaxID=312017 RepID=W7XFQ4_TETTS|nr:kinase domain protein [Tetrahymena thermophila SB210]EWS72836.1 kinase domain protein [Tetrahymena thermophila SB210]|eukprot:XP_012654627.1 kinase domain protein [Tetrahymena thermophila SB210]
MQHRISTNNIFSSGSSNETVEQSQNRVIKKSDDFIYQIFQDQQIEYIERQIIKNNIFNVFNICYISQGSEGKVYKAKMIDRSYKQFKCAIKIIQIAKQQEIFQKEIDIRNDINLIEEEYNRLQPNQRNEKINPYGIVKYYYDFKTKEGYQGVVMEYCNETLESLMKNENIQNHELIKETFINKTNSYRDLCFMQLILQTLKALNFLHYEDYIGGIKKVSYIHRDIKPMNIMIQIDTVNEFSVKIIDLGGISKQSKHDQDDFDGTIAFYPPEYIQQQVTTFDKSSDVWAIGICIYRLFAIQEKDQVKITRKNLYEDMLKRISQIWNRLDAITLRQQEGNERDQIVYEYGSEILKILLTQDYQQRNQKNYLEKVIEKAAQCVQYLQKKSKNQINEKPQSKPQMQSFLLKQMCQNPNFITDSLSFLEDLNFYFQNKKDQLNDYKLFFQVFAGFLYQNFQSYEAQIQQLNYDKLCIYNDQYFKQNSKTLTLNLLKKMLLNISELDSALNVQDRNIRSLIWCTYYLFILYKLEYYKYYNLFHECVYKITSYNEIKQMSLLELQEQIKKLLSESVPQQRFLS